MSKPTFSIITITKDDRAGFEKTLKSVKAQTCRDLEWIVVATETNNNDTLELIQENKNDIAALIYNQDTGLYNAMNIGTEHAKGEYMIYLNGGDAFYDETVLATAKEIAQTMDKPEYLYGNQFNVDKEGKATFYGSPPAEREMLIKRPASHQSLFFKREAYERMGLQYDETMKISSDTKLKIQFAQNARSFHKMDIIVNTFDTTGISNRQSLRQLYEGYKIRRTIREQSFVRASIALCVPFVAGRIRKHTPFLYERAKNLYHTLRYGQPLTQPNMNQAENHAILFSRNHNP